MFNEFKFLSHLKCMGTRRLLSLSVTWGKTGSDRPIIVSNSMNICVSFDVIFDSDSLLEMYLPHLDVCKRITIFRSTRYKFMLK